MTNLHDMPTQSFFSYYTYQLTRLTCINFFFLVYYICQLTSKEPINQFFFFEKNLHIHLFHSKHIKTCNNHYLVILNWVIINCTCVWLKILEIFHKVANQDIHQRTAFKHKIWQEENEEYEPPLTVISLDTVSKQRCPRSNFSQFLFYATACWIIIRRCSFRTTKVQFRQKSVKKPHNLNDEKKNRIAIEEAATISYS